MAIKINLPELRARAGRLSLSDLSGMTGVTVANLSRLDRNLCQRIDLDTLSKLCEALKCSPGDLLTYVPGPQQDLKPSVRKRKQADTSAAIALGEEEAFEALLRKSGLLTDGD